MAVERGLDLVVAGVVATGDVDLAELGDALVEPGRDGQVGDAGVGELVGEDGLGLAHVEKAEDEVPVSVV